MPFSEQVKSEIRKIATEQGIEDNALLTVVDVESGGTAFTTIDGQPMPLILYEYHVFYRWPGLTEAERREAVNRKLAAKRWGMLPYMKTQRARYNQLAKAAGINEQAAHAACSWGVGQVLGENAEWLGFASPVELAETAKSGLRGQIELMLRFIDKKKLRDELAGHDWRGFARLYNGPGQVDYYATRMAAAYRRHAGQNSNELSVLELRAGMTGEEVAQLQRLLRGLGYTLLVDGDFGPATRKQLIDFQRDQGLEPDGIAGPATISRLEALSGLPLAA